MLCYLFYNIGPFVEQHFLDTISLCAKLVVNQYYLVFKVRSGAGGYCNHSRISLRCKVVCKSSSNFHGN